MTEFTLRCGSAVLYRGDSLSAVAALVQANRVTLCPAQADDLRFFSVCSGIEAASVAWKPIGWKCIGVAEIEKFPSAVLAHHYPDIPNHGDFTRIDTKRLGRVDILCGGTPCQAFSVAGARRSLDDARGNLTLAFVGLAHELADNNQLRNVVWENVPGVLSTKDNAFGCFLAGLVGADEPLVPIEPKPADGKSSRWWGWSVKEKSHYVKWSRAGLVTGPNGRAAWTIKDAQYFGLAQRRERVILVADFGNGADPAAVLFEPESVRRGSPPSREAGQSVAPTISARPSGGGGLGTDFDLDGGLIQTAVTGTLTANGKAAGSATQQDAENGMLVTIANSLRSGNGGDPHDYTKGTYIPSIARCVATREGQSQDFESTTMVAVSVTGPISHALKAEGADASEDGTGRGTPIVAVDCKASGQSGFGVGNISSTMRANGGGDMAFALRASGGGGDKPHVLTHAIQAGALRENPNSGPDGVGVQADIAYTLEARAEVQAAQIGSAVRRLTPRECERLQGFQWQCLPTHPGAWQDHSGRWWSPDYTAIPWRGKPAVLCPDGPRYKALGNSWAVPKFRWLGERIQALMPH